MQNALAVYTSKRSLNGGKLIRLASEHGIPLRFMALGGYILGSTADVQGTALTTLSGGAVLLIGAFEADLDKLSEFDKLIEQGDRQPIAMMLNGGELPWCEHYSGSFDYDKTIERKPKDKSQIDGSVPKNQLPSLKCSKTRYIIYNKARRKNSGQLMARLAEILADATDGIVADYQRPSR